MLVFGGPTPRRVLSLGQQFSPILPGSQGNSYALHGCCVKVMANACLQIGDEE